MAFYVFGIAVHTFSVKLLLHGSPYIINRVNVTIFVGACHSLIEVDDSRFNHSLNLNRFLSRFTGKVVLLIKSVRDTLFNFQIILLYVSEF